MATRVPRRRASPVAILVHGRGTAGAGRVLAGFGVAFTFCSVAFAQGAAVAAMGSEAARAADATASRSAPARVGEVVFAVGSPVRMIGNATEPVRRGAAVSVGDVLATGDGDHVHIRFVDGAFVSVRPGSRLVLEAYAFDASAPAQSKVRFDLQSGVARSITGRAGEAAKDRFRLNTPVAAIGIRGTDFSVLADMQESRVAVHSGAVVVAPLGNGCSVDALGPCSGDKARELTAGLANSFARVDRQRVEVLAPGRPSLTPDRVAPPVESEPATRAPGSTERSRSTVIAELIAGRGVAAAAADAVQPGPLPPATFPSGPLTWGRWAAVAWDADSTIGAAEALVGRKATVGNQHFALFRENVAFSMPTQGKVDFALRDGQVHLTTAAGAASPGSLSDGRLTLDFDAGRFATSINASHPAIAGGSVNISATGLVNSEGMFVSNAAQSNARVAGALTRGATEAAYFFERQVDLGTLLGLTRWTR